jgi:DMSO/TMAO reductase YedYZ molybdopterin-dependent catalytic subunit
MNKYRLLIGVVVVAVLLAGAYFISASAKAPAPDVKVTAPGVGAREVTPTDKMRVRTAEGQPSIDIATYRLKVDGFVEHRLSMTFGEIQAMPVDERFVKLPCVEGWTEKAVWKGVRLADVLKSAGIGKGGETVVFKSPGGYTSSLTVADVIATDPMLAYGVNNERLPDEQGYPLRLVVPNRLGYKWVKWVTEIEVIKGGYEGYWESRGYSNDADATGR